MTLTPVQESSLSDAHKDRARELNWIAVNLRTGIHLSRPNSKCYIVHVPGDLSRDFLYDHENIFAIKTCDEHVLEGVSSDEEAIALAHFYLQAAMATTPSQNGK